MALLPYLDGYELVLTAAHEAAQEMLHWDDATFLQRLQEHFGDRVGTFTGVGKRNCYPLRLKRAPDITFPHTVLIGNAAQTLHPVAGQGFNMGIRDAWELAQVILDSAPDNIGSAAMCAAYRQSRRLDRNAGIRFTDGWCACSPTTCRCWATCAQQHSRCWTASRPRKSSWRSA